MRIKLGIAAALALSAIAIPSAVQAQDYHGDRYSYGYGHDGDRYGHHSAREQRRWERERERQHRRWLREQRRHHHYHHDYYR